jgi:hypothetical protein
MTTIIGKDIKCAVCGLKSEYLVLGSTNAFGSPDLDLRPPEMQRSTMETWVQECPGCGYCSEDVSEPVPDADEVITSDDYIRLDEEQQFPELARRFLKYACLISRENKLDIVLAHMWAAWVCDDEVDKIAEARSCRELAMQHLRSLQPYPDTEDGVMSAAIYIDMLRRNEKYQEAADMVQETLGFQSVDEVIKAVLEFQLDRCSQKDHKCYTVADAIGE